MIGKMKDKGTEERKKRTEKVDDEKKKYCNNYRKGE